MSLASLAFNDLGFSSQYLPLVRLARKGISVENIIADNGSFTKISYSGWKVENIAPFYWKLSGRKWDFID